MKKQAVWEIGLVPKAERRAAVELGKSPAWLPWVEWYDAEPGSGEPANYLEHLAASVAKWHPARGEERGSGWCYLCQWCKDDCEACPLAPLVGRCMTIGSTFFKCHTFGTAVGRLCCANLIFEALLVLYQREWFRVHGMDVLGKHPEHYLDKKKAKP